MDCIENRTFDELKVGETASLARTLTYKDIELFAIMSGDVNPAHVDEAFAKSDMFHKIVAHGMWAGADLDRSRHPNARPRHHLPQPIAAFWRPRWPWRHHYITLKVAEKKPEKHRVILDAKR